MEHEKTSTCEHPHCIAACEKGEHIIKCESCGKEWKEPCPYPPGTLHA